MKNYEWDKVWVGIALGIICPIIFYAIYYLLIDTFGLRKVNVSICVAINLIPFYIFQKKNKNNGLKGVLIATIAYAVLIACLSFFTNTLKIG